MWDVWLVVLFIKVDTMSFTPFSEAKYAGSAISENERMPRPPKFIGVAWVHWRVLSSEFVIFSSANFISRSIFRNNSVNIHNGVHRNRWTNFGVAMQFLRTKNS